MEIKRYYLNIWPLKKKFGLCAESRKDKIIKLGIILMCDGVLIQQGVKPLALKNRGLEQLRILAINWT